MGQYFKRGAGLINAELERGGSAECLINRTLDKAQRRGGRENKIKKRPDLRPAFNGDEVKYAFTQALRRATRPTWGRCPSRVASKTSMPTLNGQRNLRFLKTFTALDATRLKRFQKLFQKTLGALLFNRPWPLWAFNSDTLTLRY
jgi:hypothetical protein